MNAHWRSSLCVKIWQSKCMWSIESMQFKLAEHTDFVLERISPSLMSSFSMWHGQESKTKAAWVGWKNQRYIRKFSISPSSKFGWSQFFFYIRINIIGSHFGPPLHIHCFSFAHCDRIWLMVMYDCQQMITFSRGSQLVGIILRFGRTIVGAPRWCCSFKRKPKSHRILHKYEKHQNSRIP